jgi:phenylacetate-CoA ligase
MFAYTCILRTLLPTFERFSKTRFWSVYRSGLRFDRRSNWHRQVIRQQRLAEILAAAFRAPLYQERLCQAGYAGNGLTGDEAPAILARLPVLTKADLRRHYPTGVLTGASSTDWRYLSTSGTAERLTVVADFDKRDAIRGSELRVLWEALGADVAVRSVEIPPDACNVICGLTDPAPQSLWGYLWYSLRHGTLFTPDGQTDLRGRIERNLIHRKLPLAPLDPAPAPALAQRLDTYLDLMVAAGTDVLRAYPLYLLWLADRAGRRGVKIPGLRVVMPYGGLTSPAMARRIRDGFGVPFVDVYGSNELGSLGAGCAQTGGLHLFEDLAVSEIQRDGRSVAPGEYGKLLFTDLVNTAMPLVRYEIGDVGRRLPGPCGCGRATARLQVLGRTVEVLTTERGWLTPAEVADAAFSDPGVANFRLEEIAPCRFEAAVVATPDGPAPDLPAWEERFRKLHGGVRQCRSRLVPFLRPETSGKYRFVWPFKPVG